MCKIVILIKKVAFIGTSFTISVCLHYFNIENVPNSISIQCCRCINYRKKFRSKGSLDSSSETITKYMYSWIMQLAIRSIVLVQKCKYHLNKKSKIIIDCSPWNGTMFFKLCWLYIINYVPLVMVCFTPRGII